MAKSFFDRLTQTARPAKENVSKHRAEILPRPVAAEEIEAGESELVDASFNASPFASETDDREDEDVGGREEREQRYATEVHVASQSVAIRHTRKKGEDDEELSQEGQLMLDIFNEDDYFVVQSTIAGVKSEDVDIAVAGDTLTIRGSRKRHEKIQQDDFYAKELYWGNFSRSVILPEDVDSEHVEASLRNGLLTVRLLRKRKESKKIKVKTEQA